MTCSAPPPAALNRELGLWGAIMLGLGSIVGTGIFVSIGIGAGIAGPAVILAIAIAAVIAALNAFSSAQLAASHPVSGGTYEYGYAYLHPSLGFTAGWLFLCAKSASAATAALGLAGYVLVLLDWGPGYLIPLAVVVVALLTVVVLGDINRSNRFNMIIISFTLLALALFVVWGTPDLIDKGRGNLTPFFHHGAGSTNDGGAFLYAVAVMFVAFTGYGRIATMGEEVKAPRRTIPRAIILTLMVSAALYMTVAVVAIGAGGADALANVTGQTATPLEAAGNAIGGPFLARIIAVAAITAMLAVLLNLILGLSRVVLAMGRKGDMPPLFAKVRADGGSPSAAVIGVGIVIGALALTGSVATTWAFSAFTVLIYYAITNLAAIFLPAEARLYPRSLAILGLLACCFVAFWVPREIWLAGLGLIGLGLVWHLALTRLWRRR